MKNSMRLQLTALRQRVTQDFLAQKPMLQLVHEYTRSIDEILVELWQKLQLDQFSNLCLIACGGYGREELQLHSDIDLLILSKTILPNSEQKIIEEFVHACWDSGLRLSQNVHTLQNCVELAKSDVTVMTSLMESRALVENRDLFHELQKLISTSFIWPSQEFFEKKWQEQQRRYNKFNNTAYNLEPNVKQGPGGLRDIHMIAWVAKRHFGGNNLKELVTSNFLKEEEYQTLLISQSFLWRVSFALHILTGRSESRLLFDYQAKLAAQFGYQDRPQQLAIEQFMKDYFCIAKSVRALNDMLLQLFREVMLEKDEPRITSINERFQVCNHYIEVTHENVFKDHPESLLEIFLLMARYPEIRGTRASTIRMIHEYIDLIDQSFRENKLNCQMFLDLLRQSGDISIVLQRMNRYGIIGKYLPAFGQIIGQMQYDLFHVYTVDHHTLIVIRNLCRFYQSEYRGKFPLCAEIIETITKPELLYLAALFHDIAKGRGGDHSVLGSQDALEFCHLHGIVDDDSMLVTWLVENHLLMSMTAQREDIYDPNTIIAFADKLPAQRYLDYLYLLTVADINATNPSLWNSWKDSLLKELYERTNQLLKQQNKTVDTSQLIREKMITAYELLSLDVIKPTAINELWQHFPQTYYLQESPANIAWHTQFIMEHSDSTEPLVFIKQHKQSATEIVIYCKYHTNLFALSTAVLTNLNLNILEARFNNLSNGHTLSSYVVLDSASGSIDSQIHLDEIKQNLIQSYLSKNKSFKLRTKRPPRHLQYFSYKPTVKFTMDKHRNRTIMEITALDRSGLLAQIGKIFIKHEVQLHHAKINTMGERIEDRFFITNLNNQLIDDKIKLEILSQKVLQVLS